MTELYLVRHGQASFGTDNYDQLSELGYQQARWLGEYYAERDILFDRVITGFQARQRQTAQSILAAAALHTPLETHQGFNEFDFEALIATHLELHPPQEAINLNDSRQAYRLLRLSMNNWATGKLQHPRVVESWQQFNQRVADGWEFALQGPAKKILVVSSGGAISCALSQVMGFDHQTLINLNLQTRNTGISHFFHTSKVSYVTCFNNVPHLDRTDRLHAITYT